MDNHNTFVQHFPVSRETLDKLVFYKQELTQWNRAHNLINADDLENFWTRHALDCAQLINYIPKTTQYVLDLGAGAGLPGLIIAILTNFKVILFELKKKKATFLWHIINQLKLDASVVEGDAAQQLAASDFTTNIVVTSRALGSVNYIMKIIAAVSRETNLICLLLKSRSQSAKEIPIAHESWHFAHEILPSLTSPEGCILKITNIQPKR